MHGSQCYQRQEHYLSVAEYILGRLLLQHKEVQYFFNGCVIQLCLVILSKRVISRSVKRSSLGHKKTSIEGFYVPEGIRTLAGRTNMSI